MSSTRGVKRHPLTDKPQNIGTTDWENDFNTGEAYSPVHEVLGFKPADRSYTPEPGGKCKLTTIIELIGFDTFIEHPHGVTFIFVQGKESACIVTRDLGKDKIQNLLFNFMDLADVRLVKASAIGHVFEQPAEMYPYAVVSVLLNSDDVNGETGSKPSSHKASSSLSKPLNEKAAVRFLKLRLEDDGFKETIQEAISALQLLYEENVQADEITAYTAHVDNTEKFLSRGEIEMHLASSLA